MVGKLHFALDSVGCNLQRCAVVCDAASRSGSPARTLALTALGTMPARHQEANGFAAPMSLVLGSIHQLAGVG